MFSGRPNPNLTLSVDESRQLLDTLERFREGPCPEPPGLGYRGIVLYDEARNLEVTF